MIPDDPRAEYYACREAIERGIAERTENPDIALIHRELVNRYAQQAHDALLLARR